MKTTKTEQEMLEKVYARGFAVLIGSRAFQVCKRVEKNYPSLKFTFSISNKAFGKSDWELDATGARRAACYEVSVQIR